MIYSYQGACMTDEPTYLCTIFIVIHAQIWELLTRFLLLSFLQLETFPEAEERDLWQFCLSGIFSHFRGNLSHSMTMQLISLPILYVLVYFLNASFFSVSWCGQPISFVQALIKIFISECWRRNVEEGHQVEFATQWLKSGTNVFTKSVGSYRIFFIIFMAVWA